METTIFSFISILAVLGAIGIWYHGKKNKPKNIGENWKKYLVYLVIIYGLFASIFFAHSFFTCLCVVIILIGAYELWKVWRNDTKHRYHILLISVIIYLVISYGFIRFSLVKDSAWQAWIYFTVLTFDGFSQVCGQLFGKHKLVPLISPNKTVEGFLGGFIIATITSFLVIPFSLYSSFISVLLIIVVCFASFAGDIAASRFKRLHRVKDYSQLIPGHGGILDRFDSFLMTGCIWWMIN